MKNMLDSSLTLNTRLYIELKRTIADETKNRNPSTNKAFFSRFSDFSLSPRYLHKIIKNDKMSNSESTAKPVALADFSSNAKKVETIKHKVMTNIETYSIKMIFLFIFSSSSDSFCSSISILYKVLIASFANEPSSSPILAKVN